MFSGMLALMLLGSTTTSAADAPQDSSSLMKRGEKLEQDIAQHQREARQAGGASAAKYDQGFHDGYNKAVLDLVKSKLMAAQPDAAKKLATASAPAPAKTAPVPAAPPASASSNVAFWIGKSVASLQGQHWDLAIEAANEAIKADPRHIAPYINRSWAYAEKGFIQRAITDANQAILIDPKNPLSYNNRGYAHELGGKVVDAKADYQQACNYSYRPACDYSFKIASIAAADISKQVSQLLSDSYEKFKRKDWQGVVALSTRAINLDTGNATAYANRAGALTELGKLSDALADSNKAIQLNPQFGVAHNNQGYVYELMGKHKQAAQSYKNACDLGLKTSCTDYRRMAASVASN